MLHVHGGEDVDAGFEQRVDILPALEPLRSGYVGVREFVDDGHRRPALQDGLGIHLFEARTGVRDHAPRERFQTLGLGDGFLAAVRLEIPDHNVHALWRSSWASSSMRYVLPTPAAYPM